MPQSMVVCQISLELESSVQNVFRSCHYLETVVQILFVLIVLVS